MALKEKGYFVELLDGTFNLMSRTWITSLVVGGVLFIPTSFLFGWAYSAFMNAILGMAEKVETGPESMLIALGIGYLWIILAALAQGLVFLFVRACVTEHAARATRAEPASLIDMIVHVATKVYPRLLVQRIVQLVILSITFGAVFLIAGMAVGICIALSSVVLAVILGVLLGLAGTAVFIWISVRYTVTLESLVIEGTGVDESFDRSMAVVRLRWWRVFGYTLLFALMVSFASSLIATPIMFFSTIRQFMHALETVLREGAGSQGFNQMFLKLLAGMGRRLGIAQYVQSMIGGFMTPVFMTLLFLRLTKPPVPETAAPVLESDSVSGGALPQPPEAAT